MVASTVVVVPFIGAAVFSPWIAPHDPHALASFSRLDNDKPPVGLEERRLHFVLGTDGHGQPHKVAVAIGGDRVAVRARPSRAGRLRLARICADDADAAAGSTVLLAGAPAGLSGTRMSGAA